MEEQSLYTRILHHHHQLMALKSRNTARQQHDQYEPKTSQCGPNLSILPTADQRPTRKYEQPQIDRLCSRQ
jgi:hypothetical protein